MKKLFLYLSILSITFLSACSDNNNSQQEPAVIKVNDPKIQESTLIVTSFYPLAFITEQIVQDKAEVINMAGAVDVHAYQPSPQDLVKVNQADLVVFQGAELESWTDDVIPELTAKGVATLEVSSKLVLNKMEKHEGSHGEHEESEEGKHSEHEESEEGGHDEHHHGEYDPHTWLDPVLAQQMIDQLLQSIVLIDPKNEASYKANAKALKDRFAQLDNSFKTELTQCSNKELIISHDAYGYLALRYGFQVHTITGFSPQDEPSAKILAELKEEAAEGISHILVEENNVRRFADTLARETGLATLPVNPLGRGTLDPQKDFFDIMQENLNSFKTALHCQK